ncbi:MAG TPA: hypothetical protein VHO84_12735, partial [Syntrophorhabdaceae bacterium]|nr:hypothetical protein [Syntrophorhabdaceae bacterium]
MKYTVYFPSKRKICRWFRVPVEVTHFDYYRVVVLCILILLVSGGGYAQQTEPKNAWEYHNRALEYIQKGMYDLAVGDLTSAVNLDSSQAAIFISRGFAYFLQNDYVRAISDYS